MTVLNALILTFICGLGAFAQAQGLHVIFDLDSTLITRAQTGDSGDLVTFGNETYRYADFAPELIARLAQAGYHVSFFSGGQSDRNHAVITHLQDLIQSRTGYTFTPEKILSYENLTPVFGAPENAPMTKRFKKDVQWVADPHDVILVDDHADFILPGEERSLLNVSPEMQSVRGRQKLVVVMEILLEAQDIMSRSTAQYLQAVRGLAAGTTPGPNYNDEAFVDLLRKGLARLGSRLSLNPGPTQRTQNSCRAVFL